MKRIMLALAATLLMAPQALAYAIGFVDMAKIQQESTMFKQAQSEFTTAQGKYQKALEERQKRLEEAKRALESRQKRLDDAKKAMDDKDSKTPLDARRKELEEAQRTLGEDEPNKLQEQFGNELGAMRDQLQGLESSLYQKIDTKLNASVKSVAAKRKVDIVLTKQAVFYGGTDITSEVIKSLNK